MADTKTILAVAVGPSRQMMIQGKHLADDVRPYIAGLIEGLAQHGHQIGTDFEIDYREQPALDSKGGAGDDAFKPDPDKPYDLIFAMSTTVVRAARQASKTIPIVGVVSDSIAEGFSRADNITGISARRSQTADRCFQNFLATVPSLKRAFVLHKKNYGPSERALKLVRKVAKARGVKITVVPVKTREDVAKKLATLPKRKAGAAPDAGLFLLPVDVCLGWTSRIVDLSQGQKGIPAFFPITDCVTGAAGGALGGYGVPQRRCGELMAQYVAKILWGNAKPKELKVEAASDQAFEWVVSRQAAEALNVRLPHLI